MTAEIESGTPEKVKVARKSFFIVFSPTGPHPPTRAMDSHKAAFFECHRLAKMFPGQQFFVMKSKSWPIQVSEDATLSSGSAR